MILAAILLGLVANLDNLTVGIGYGVQHRLIRLGHNLLIAAVTTAVTLVALTAGRELHRYLLPAVPDWTGGLALILFAVAELLWPGRKSATAARIVAVGWRETAFLAVTLSINNTGLGVAGGFTGVGYGPGLSCIFGFSVILLSAGQFIGQRARRRLADSLTQNWIGSVILMLAGVMMMSGL